MKSIGNMFFGMLIMLVLMLAMLIIPVYPAMAATPPAVSTVVATEMTNSTVILNGSLNELGTATTVGVSFEYGYTTAYGKTTAAQPMVANGIFSAPIIGLFPGMVWHFRAKAVGDGTVYGDDMIFTTAAVPYGTAKFGFVSARDGNQEVYAITPDGQYSARLTENAFEEEWPRFAADFTKVTFTSWRDGNAEVYGMNPDGTGQTRITTNTAFDGMSDFSWNGSRIVFVSDRDGNYEIYVMNADGTGQTRLTNNAAADIMPVFSPDGTKIAFASNRDGTYEIYLMSSLDGSGLTRLTNNAVADYYPSWLNDGTKLCFSSMLSGTNEIYTMDANGGNQALLTTDGLINDQSSWCPTGGAIFYTSWGTNNTPQIMFIGTGPNAGAGPFPFTANAQGNWSRANWTMPTTQTYTLTYTAGANGTITGTSPQTVVSGASGAAVTAVPATGYHFVSWSDASTANPRTDTNVNANIAVTASFAQAASTQLSIYTTLTPSQVYQLLKSDPSIILLDTRIYGEYTGELSPFFGHITGALSLVDDNSTLLNDLSRFPDKTRPYICYCNTPECHHGWFVASTMYNLGYTNITYMPEGVAGWKAANYPFSTGADPGLINPVEPSFTISASVTGTGGTISPSGVVTVTSGASQTFTITPTSGYSVSALIVDGATVAAAPTYTFTNVTANHTIQATFASMPTFTINASVSGAGGTISPSGDVTINLGASQTFTVTANSGYHITDVVVDGNSQGAIGTYTFTDMIANHTIAASFAVDVSSGGGSSGGGGGGSYSPPPGYTNLSDFIGFEGTVLKDAAARSQDKKVVLLIAKGVRFLTASGSGVSGVTINPRNDKLVPPEGSGIIGLCYNFGPERATFDPGATVTMSYAGLNLDTFNENNLALASWDSHAGQWVKLSSYQLDTENKTVSAVITHFSTYGILGYPPTPAAFTISNLVVTPASVEAGKDVTVTINVTNSGEVSGVYNAALMVGGTAEPSKDVTIEARETQQVSFQIKRDQPGTYPLSIGSLNGSFTALKPAAVTISDLVVSPSKVEAGKDITVTFQVVNTGEVTGTYPAALQIGNITEATRDIDLDAGESKTVTFIVNRSQPGIYNVTAGELSASIEVTTIESTTQTASASAAALTTSKSSNLWWWVGLVLAVGLLVIVLVKTRRRNRLQ